MNDLRDRWGLGPVTGTVTGVAGHQLDVRGLRLAVGDGIRILTAHGEVPGEVIGLDPEGARAMVYGETHGIGRGDRVAARPGGVTAPIGPELLGRVVDAFGRPLDGGPSVAAEPCALHLDVPSPLERRRVDRPLPVGVRLIDALCTTGAGQRVGIFAGSGVGKSTLLGMMVRGTTAEVAVIAMIGERGREVREFVEDILGPDGLANAVVVVATSDEPPLVRLRAAFLATRIAEWFADAGRDVLLTVDSLTRLAMAQRDVGLAAGEPPTTRGYTPSCFSLLPRLLERAGPRVAGTVTAFYTVLVEGDDMNDPIADAARSILDGHLVLDRRLTTLGRFPAIDPLASLSRVQGAVTSEAERGASIGIRAALAAMEEVRDLVEVGAYVPGTNRQADLALAARDELIGFLSQRSDDVAAYGDTWERAAALAAAVDPAEVAA